MRPVGVGLAIQGHGHAPYSACMSSTTLWDSEDEREFLAALGRHLREHRQHLGLTQSQVAEMAGLERQWVGHVERGQANISVLNLRRVANVLECTVLGLLEDT